jgi:predicted alpha/beta-hydrolase family hydrolase
MPTDPEPIQVKVNELGSVTALLYVASKKKIGTTIVLGHGAGANQLSGFMRLFSSGLAARGLDALTFNFLYKEQGRSVPDHKTKLEACYSAVIEAARRHRKLKANDLVIGGKSMGGRIASQVAASGVADLAGLVFLGYPLHPPGRPEKLRAEHLKDISAPMLFMQGSKDAFGTSDEIREVIKNMSLPATLYEVAGGDHSFKVPKSGALPQDQVYEAAMDEIVKWLQARK